MNSYTIRAVRTDEDAQALTAFVARLEGIDLEAATTHVNRLRERLGNSFAERALLAVHTSSSTAILGSVVLLNSPNHGFELLGGVAPHADRAVICTQLLEATQARAIGFGTYTYADEAYWDATTLERLGYREVAQYRQLRASSLSLSSSSVGAPIKSFLEHRNLDDLVTALRFYEDLWGHHTVNAAQVAASLEGFDPRNIALMFDDHQYIAGVCRATLDGTRAWVDAPSLRPDLRHPERYLALLRHALLELRTQGATAFTLESWGDVPEVVQAYLDLGFTLETSNAIVAQD